MRRRMGASEYGVQSEDDAGRFVSAIVPAPQERPADTTLDCNARGGNRTRTPLPGRDFKSLASALSPPGHRKKREAGDGEREA
jgi:hypothetical protein